MQLAAMHKKRTYVFFPLNVLQRRWLYLLYFKIFIRDVCCVYHLDYILRDLRVAYAADFNLIENIWVEPIRAIHENPPSSRYQMIQIVKNAWREIQLSKIRKIYRSLRTRIEQCRDRDGGLTDY